MKQIPDAAVQAALDSWFGAGEEDAFKRELHFDSMKEALAATLPHFPLGYEVKKLEWVPIVNGGKDRQAKCELGEYVISVDSVFAGSTHYLWIAGQHEDSDPHFEFRTLKEAKSAAQADFERRILSCVVTKPVDVAAVRECVNKKEEFEIDKLRFRAFRTNTEADRQAYFDAVSKWFQDRHYRRMDAERALSVEPAQGARPLEEWHEDHGNVVWWAWDNDRQAWLGEPAYIGKPLDSDWPEYHTHWTPHPTFPAAPTLEAAE